MTVSGTAATGGYESFFGLKESPFSLSPNPKFLFESATHMAALEQVTYALWRREPLVVVTGEIGTGKTMLCRTVLDRLERLTFLSIIADPLLGRDDLLKQILEDFGVISKGRSRLVQPGRHELIRALQEFLISLIPLQAHAVVMIDEAQHLHPEVLEEIRLLSNIEADRGTQLQIVLVGQADLEVALKRPDMRQFEQRVTRRFQLQPLDDREVREYIEHRLAVATGAGQAGGPSGENAPGLFATDAMEAVARLSGGLPRVINIVCDRALEAAFALRQHSVHVGAVESAARALGMSPPALPAPQAPLALSKAGGPALSLSADFDRLFEEAAASAPHRPLHAPRPEPAAPQAVFSLPNLSDPRALLALSEGEGADLLDRPALGEVEGPGPLALPALHEPDLSTFEPRAAAPETRRYVIAALVVATVAVAVWFGTRGSSAPPAAAPAAPAAAPAPSAPTPTPGTAAPPEAASTPTSTGPGKPAQSAVGTPRATAPRTTPAEPAAPGSRFEIVVASFRTDSRAATVAEDVTTLGLTQRTRTVGDGWRQVLVGPFSTRAEAEGVQQRLDDAGLGASQIVAR